MNSLPFPSRLFEIDSFNSEAPDFDPARDERVLAGTVTVYIDNDPFDINWTYREFYGVEIDSQFELYADEEYQLFYAIEEYMRDLEHLGKLDF